MSKKVYYDTHQEAARHRGRCERIAYKLDKGYYIVKIKGPLPPK